MTSAGKTGGALGWAFALFLAALPPGASGQDLTGTVPDLPEVVDARVTSTADRARLILD